MNTIISKELLNSYLDKNLVTARKHPDTDLFILNYTPKVQYDKLWDEFTMRCRGLIIDGKGQIQARPFCKFFNIEEINPADIPNESFIVLDKMDGSLGVMYYLDNKPFIATRGSFTSPQAIKANKLLYTKYAEHIDNLAGFKDSNYTWLFEIISSESRIVLKYEEESLTLLAAKDKRDDHTFLENISAFRMFFPIVKHYHGIKDIAEIKSLEQENKEGVVLRFKNGFMFKCKWAEYVRLHRIITQVSNKVLWENLRDNKPMDEILERVPDEFYAWVKETIAGLQTEYKTIEDNSRTALETLSYGCMDRKEFALQVFKRYKEYSSVIFNMADKKDYSSVIYKMIKPEFSKPFKTDIEV